AVRGSLAPCRGPAACATAVEDQTLVKAKRRITTSRDARPGGIQRGPTPRRKLGRPTGASIPMVDAPSNRRAPARRAVEPVDTLTPPRSVEVDLTVDLGRGLVLPNPILVASGTFGYGIEYGDVVEVDRLGAICCKGTTLKPRVGNITPRVTETPGGMLNSIGLQNPGVDAVIEKYAASWAGWKTPVIVNVAGESVADYVEVVRRLEGVPSVAAIELNISCPNVGRGGLQFAIDAGAAGEVTAAVRRATDLPLLVKLSPNVADVRPIARAIADAGADALTAINTLSGIAVAPGRTKPLLGNIYGGLSGPAIKPVALRIVYEVAQIVDIPVVAIGGVTELADVLDFLAVGAVAVQVGTAIFADPTLPVRLVDELAAECRRRGFSTHRDLIGTALAQRPPAPSSKGVEYRP
ncbi:MAG TPA: dihydroorotate dehydrogenase, partial [Candidatus Limnocylindrales bacterium]|nr:dihydroorotate dehydrogenase [Candidatus Limnocylindrales bacterium]